jgi:hypothetical protein
MPKSARKSEGVEPSSSSDRAPACVSIQRNAFVLATRVKKQFGVPPTLRLSEVLCRLGDRDERSRTYSDDPKGARCSSFGIRQVVCVSVPATRVR